MIEPIRPRAVPILAAGATFSQHTAKKRCAGNGSISNEYATDNTDNMGLVRVPSR